MSLQPSCREAVASLPGPPRFVVDDGGRAAAGFQGEIRDCVTRAIAIAAEIAYEAVYDKLSVIAQAERRPKGRSSARKGVRRVTYEMLFLGDLGATWTSRMAIGSGCTVHLRGEELPMGRLVVQVSKHLVAVIDGVIHDTHDPSRAGTRCVYGSYTLAAEPAR